MILLKIIVFFYFLFLYILIKKSNMKKRKIFKYDEYRTNEGLKDVLVGGAMAASSFLPTTGYNQEASIRPTTELEMAGKRLTTELITWVGTDDKLQYAQCRYGSDDRYVGDYITIDGPNKSIKFYVVSPVSKDSKGTLEININSYTDLGFSKTGSGRHKVVHSKFQSGVDNDLRHSYMTKMRELDKKNTTNKIKYAVQIGSFDSINNAKKLIEETPLDSSEVYVVEKDGKYCVFYGDSDNRADADVDLAFVKKYYSDAFITKHNIPKEMQAQAQAQAQAQRQPQAQAQRPSMRPQIHIVGPNEELRHIASKYNITVDQIRELNNMERGETILPGQRIIVKLTANPTDATKPMATNPNVSQTPYISKNRYFTIQIASSNDEKNATKYADSFGKHTAVFRDTTKNIFKVVYGAYKTKEEALKDLTNIKQSKPDAFISSIMIDDSEMPRNLWNFMGMDDWPDRKDHMNKYMGLDEPQIKTVDNKPPTVVNQSPINNDKLPKPVELKGDGFVIQIASYFNKKYADKKLNDMLGSMIDGLMVVQGKDDKGETTYRLVVGEFKTKTDAMNYLNYLLDNGLIEEGVVKPTSRTYNM
jgi:cell division septation protein DedD